MSSLLKENSLIFLLGLIRKETNKYFLTLKKLETTKEIGFLQKLYVSVLTMDRRVSCYSINKKRTSTAIDVICGHVQLCVFFLKKKKKERDRERKEGGMIISICYPY